MNDIVRNLNYLRHEKFFKNICVPAILGALTTIWTHAILAVSVYDSLFHSDEKIIIDAIRQTHYIISIATTISLIHGLTKIIRYFILPWLLWKGIECTAYLLSLIWYLGTRYRWRYDYVFLGLGILIVNLCLIRFMWNTFKATPDLPPKYEETKNAENADSPPTFEECTNEPTNMNTI